MFGLGITEIITLIIVIIVFMNPRDLPLIVRKTGKIYGKIMREINGIRKTFSDFEQEVKEFSGPAGKLISRQEDNNCTIKGVIK